MVAVLTVAVLTVAMLTVQVLSAMALGAAGGTPDTVADQPRPKQPWALAEQTDVSHSRRPGPLAELGRSATLLIEESFETPELFYDAQFWNDTVVDASHYAPNTSESLFTTAIVHSGSYAMNYYAIDGTDERTPFKLSHLDANSPIRLGFYVEWYMLALPGYPWDHAQKIFRTGNAAGQQGAGIGIAAGFGNATLSLQVNNYDSATEWFDQSPPLVEGSWQKIGVWVKLNDIGSANGFVRFYRDDALSWSVENVELRSSSAELTYLWLGGNYNTILGGSGQIEGSGSIYYDTIRLYNTGPSICVRTDTIGDLNGDRDPDLFWAKDDGAHAAWLMNDTSLVSAAWLASVADTDWQLRGSADFDHDGYEDVVFRHRQSGLNAVWLLDGTGTIRAGVYLPPAPPNWMLVATGDLDCDGWDDLIWRNDGGENAVWHMIGTTVAGTAYLDSLTLPNWELVGTGDVDLDGHVDIVWRNGTTGENAVWLMNGTTLLSGAFLPALTGANWTVGALSDYNADGKVDIVWRDAKTGQNVVWLMDGLTISQGLFLPSVNDATWRLVGPR